MEQIIITVLFLGPGMLINAINKFMKNSRGCKQNIYEYLFEMVAHSFIVFVNTLIIIKSLAIFFHDLGKNNNLEFMVNSADKFSFKTLSALTNSMDDILFSLAYIGFTLLVTVIWWRIYDLNMDNWLLGIKNKINKDITGVESTKNKSVFEGIFHNPNEVYERLLPVSIYKEDKLITSGCIFGWNSPDSEKIEYKLKFTQEIQHFLEEDKNRDDKDKMFPDIRYEYFSPEDGMRIVFYNRQRLEKHWGKIN
ncbi:MAG: hypothetical protein AB9836_04450 [Aminipila sp.]